MSHIDITFLGKGYGCPSYSDIPEIPGKILVKEKKKIRQTIIKTIKNINEKRRKKKIKAKRKKLKQSKTKQTKN